MRTLSSSIQRGARVRSVRIGTSTPSTLLSTPPSTSRSSHLGVLRPPTREPWAWGMLVESRWQSPQPGTYLSCPLYSQKDYPLRITCREVISICTRQVFVIISPALVEAVVGAVYECSD